MFIFSMDLIILQVDKLKVLSESLASSASKAEKRISDNRFEASLWPLLHVPPPSSPPKYENNVML